MYVPYAPVCARNVYMGGMYACVVRMYVWCVCIHVCMNEWMRGTCVYMYVMYMYACVHVCMQSVHVWCVCIWGMYVRYVCNCSTTRSSMVRGCWLCDTASSIMSEPLSSCVECGMAHVCNSRWPTYTYKHIHMQAHKEWKIHKYKHTYIHIQTLTCILKFQPTKLSNKQTINQAIKQPTKQAINQENNVQTHNKTAQPTKNLRKCFDRKEKYKKKKINKTVCACKICP